MSPIPLSPTPVSSTSGRPAEPPAARHRAPALAPEERRQEIIAATLPLMQEHGAGVTTSQIAQAAGIAEGTIFRVFQDKREVLLAALQTAMSADAEVARIAEIPAAMPLVERLLAAMAAIGDYQDRLWWIMRALEDLGWRPDRDEHGQHSNGPRPQMQRIAVAVAGLFLPLAGSLRLEPLPTARTLLALAFTKHLHEQGMGEPSTTAEQLVDLFLHGALRQPDGTPTSGGAEPC